MGVQVGEPIVVAGLDRQSVGEPLSVSDLETLCKDLAGGLSELLNPEGDTEYLWEADGRDVGIDVLESIDGDVRVVAYREGE